MPDEFVENVHFSCENSGFNKERFNQHLHAFCLPMKKINI